MSFQVDEKKLKLLSTMIKSKKTKAKLLKQEFASFEIPEDNEFEKLDFSKGNEMLAKIESALDKTAMKLDLFLENLAKVENQNMQIGDEIALPEGLQYYEGSAGLGRSGVVGVNEPTDRTYFISKAAYYIDGKLVSVVSETGADIDEYKSVLAKEHGVDVSKIDVSLCHAVSVNNENIDMGWIVQADLDKGDVKVKGQADTGSVQVSTEDMESAMKEIDEKYDLQILKNKTVSTAATQTVEVEDNSSVGWTIAEGAYNVAKGFISPVTTVIDLIPKCETKKWLDEKGEYFDAKGSMVSATAEKWQKTAGQVAFLATAAGVGTAISNAYTASIQNARYTTAIFEYNRALSQGKSVTDAIKIARTFFSDFIAPGVVAAV